MAHRLLRDTEADGWERSDFPIICESCLGENPYVRMTKANFDKECKICTRPFTVFRWRPGRDARYKKTEICQTCSKLKNVCQVCLLDLEYGLPVQVRDTALGIDTTEAIPKSDVNREYFAEEQDRKARAGLDFDSQFGKARANDTILKLQRTTPYYKRNRAHICSFFVRGECSRGAECPYRHEMPQTGELSQQNIKDRYYGVNDPVANKLLRKAGEMPSLEPPSDLTIKTLYIGGLDERIREEDLKDHFYAYGEIESIRLVPTRSCAFVAYTTREGAEKAADSLANKLVIKGLRLKLMWGRPPAPRPDPADAAKSAQGAAASAASAGLLPRPVHPPGVAADISSREADGRYQVALPSGPMLRPDEQQYPSMDPERMGAVVPSEPESAPDQGAAGQSAAPPRQHMHEPWSFDGRGPPGRHPPPFGGVGAAGGAPVHAADHPPLGHPSHFPQPYGLGPMPYGRPPPPPPGSGMDHGNFSAHRPPPPSYPLGQFPRPYGTGPPPPPPLHFRGPYRP